MKKLFTSESVTEGHPDKICDQISDAILDECLRQDPESRVAVECLTKTGVVIAAGELTTKANIDVPKIARKTLNEIGYTKSSHGIHADTCAIMTHIEEQSPDISQGVTEGEGEFTEQGAGDQGMMFGFACDETEELMPLPISLAHGLTKKLSDVRKSGEINYLCPDGKAQVTIEYVDDKPVNVHTVVVSSQHDEGVEQETLKKDILEKVIKPVCGDYLTEDTRYFINPTGRFVLGGPYADAGLTGRKIIVDTYGGMGRHGGGAFSGKDPSKVDRSAAYAARFIAKNLVSNGLCKKCEVGLSYAIGVAEPVSIFVDSFGTSEKTEEELVEVVKKNFPLKPAEILKYFDLKKPMYRETAAYGHFGDFDYPWEKIIEL
ncbi:methionine adenosyltransferase [Candidatus Woesearchaeota archaeon]|jgi:S-adenosylmethionine synthetase|nr:methionine adenosyltransferase [Candidatus Woesearchaeota archaeon]MBT3438625.1 methionine adenosyltransferase [Candidatus Woesearchaeota archaeon]MBT4058477.1 methionine adenosyltransferase [Candidatus Woesearchaeota archaeon]MBT4207310.1 methionine adenosyltransferase [Candidatus Woesearchaeota archaeon]MBT4730967.1 methionine adenosyltransferase [Candidatus Woesearchaeota archaeon]